MITQKEKLLQVQMKQVYFDLKLPIKVHMVMAQKRFTCYKFYAKIVHGACGTYELK